MSKKSLLTFSLSMYYIFLITVLHQLDQKIIYPHYDFKHLTEKYFEIGMKLDDFLIQLVKYCIKIIIKSILSVFICQYSYYIKTFPIIIFESNINWNCPFIIFRYYFS